MDKGIGTKAGRPGRGIYHFCPRPFGRDSVMWLYVPVSEAWKYNLAACLKEKEMRFGE